jgi:hypothetical protein
MPTPILVERVTAVLLIDGWHYIQPRSFSIGDYAFLTGDETDAEARPQRAYFFSKIDQISRELQFFAGPLDCVMAFRYAIPTEVVAEAGGSAEDDNAEVF